MFRELLQGTWAIGGWMWGGTDERESIRAIDAALDKGINLIDTAPVYGFGVSEEIVGKAIEKRGHREKVFIATKVGLEWRTSLESPQRYGARAIPQNWKLWQAPSTGSSTRMRSRRSIRFCGRRSLIRLVPNSWRRRQETASLPRTNGSGVRIEFSNNGSQRPATSCARRPLVKILEQGRAKR
jgi:aryl-alcohol dehydrogenase-like predicted oxidoreductase